MQREESNYFIRAHWMEIVGALVILVLTLSLSIAFFYVAAPALLAIPAVTGTIILGCSLANLTPVLASLLLTGIAAPVIATTLAFGLIAFNYLCKGLDWLDKTVPPTEEAMTAHHEKLERMDIDENTSKMEILRLNLKSAAFFCRRHYKKIDKKIAVLALNAIILLAGVGYMVASLCLQVPLLIAALPVMAGLTISIASIVFSAARWLRDLGNRRIGLSEAEECVWMCTKYLDQLKELAPLHPLSQAPVEIKRLKELLEAKEEELNQARRHYSQMFQRARLEIAALKLAAQHPNQAPPQQIAAGDRDNQALNSSVFPYAALGLFPSPSPSSSLPVNANQPNTTTVTNSALQAMGSIYRNSTNFSNNS